MIIIARVCLKESRTEIILFYVNASCDTLCIFSNHRPNQTVLMVCPVLIPRTELRRTTLTFREAPRVNGLQNFSSIISEHNIEKGGINNAFSLFAKRGKGLSSCLESLLYCQHCLIKAWP